MTKTNLDPPDKEAIDVLSILDRWSGRLDGHCSQKRQISRRPFRSRITIYIPGADSLAGESAEAANFQAWGRNLSQTGLGFVYKGQIKSENLIICLDPDATGSHWFNAELVRSRQVHNDFWEYGVKFIGRAEM